jgi:hypothetical protein
MFSVVRASVDTSQATPTLDWGQSRRWQSNRRYVVVMVDDCDWETIDCGVVGPWTDSLKYGLKAELDF